MDWRELLHVFYLIKTLQVWVRLEHKGFRTNVEKLMAPFILILFILIIMLQRQLKYKFCTNSYYILRSQTDRRLYVRWTSKG